MSNNGKNLDFVLWRFLVVTAGAFGLIASWHYSTPLPAALFIGALFAVLGLREREKVTDYIHERNLELAEMRLKPTAVVASSPPSPTNIPAKWLEIKAERGTVMVWQPKPGAVAAMLSEALQSGHFSWRRASGKTGDGYGWMDADKGLFDALQACLFWAGWLENGGNGATIARDKEAEVRAWLRTSLLRD